MTNILKTAERPTTASTTKRLQVPRRIWLRGLRYLAPGLLILLVAAGFDLLDVLGSPGIDISWSRRTWLELYGVLLLLAFVLAFCHVWIEKEDLRVRMDISHELVRWQRLIRQHAQERPRTEMEYKSWEIRADDLLQSLHTFLRTNASGRWARAIEELEDIPPSDTRNFWNNDGAGRLRKLKRTDERLSQFLGIIGSADQPAGQTDAESREALARTRR